MKIAWVTPFNERSAIGKVSATITAALAKRGHEMLVVGSEYDAYDPTPRQRSDLPFTQWRDRDPVALAAEYDAVIVNVGDNYGFHAGVVDYVGRIQCLGIFHDFCIYHLFTGWLSRSGHNADVRRREIDYLYGAGSGLAMDHHFGPTADLASIVAQAPMTEWMSRRCGAALAHSGFYLPALAKGCPGPTAMAYLTQAPRNVPSLPERSGDLTVTTVGWINANKCADVVIEALATSPQLAGRVRYRLVGPIPDSERSRLLKVAAAHGFERLDIVGEVDEATLDAELTRSDILCCLRRPILEGASASAIEAMMAGRPVIVADDGFYSELPAEHVLKVPKEVPVTAVREALEALIADEPRRRRLGEGAKAWALETFSAERYMDTLEELLERFVSIRPHLAASRSIGNELVRLGLNADDPAVGRIGAVMQDLFDRV